MLKRWGVLLPLAALLAACGSGGTDVFVFGPDGKPLVSWAIVVAIRPGATTHDARSRLMGSSGPVRIPADAIHPDSRLVVYAPGCRLVDRPMPRDEVAITLERGIPVRVLLEEGLALPDPDLTISVEFDALDLPAVIDRDPSHWFRECVVPADYHELSDFDRRRDRGRFSPSVRTLELLFPYAGRWRPEISIIRFRTKTRGDSGSESGSGRVLQEGSTPAIMVEPGLEAQEATLAPDREEFRRVLEDVRSDR